MFPPFGPRGQIKPPGIPVINWHHPMSAGLIFYGFDSGDGSIHDLAGGRAPAGYVSGSTIPPIGTTYLGNAISWQGSASYSFPPDAIIKSVTASGVFTFACGYIKNGTVVSFSRPFGRTANNNGNPSLNWDFEANWNGNGQATVRCQVDSSGAGTGIDNSWTNAPANNVFVSILGTVGGGNGAWYAQGALGGTGSGLTVQSADTNSNILFSGASAASVTNPFIGFVFYGAFWSRQLSSFEAMWLHYHPYSHLVFPGNRAEFSFPLRSLILPAAISAVARGLRRNATISRRRLLCGR